MPIVRRQIVCQVRVGTVIYNDFMQIRIANSLTQGSATCTLVFPIVHGNYDDDVEVLVGAIPGNGLAPRFRGKRRNAHFELWPRGVTIDCIGSLGVADEYLNWEDPVVMGGNPDAQGAGGLFVQQLVPGSPLIGGGATAGQIISAVLYRASVPHNPALLGDSGRIYGVNIDGSLNSKVYLWNAGTMTAEDISKFAYRKAGESALNYIHRYDQIDAQYDAATSSGGFFRTFESLGGDIYRVRVGGRPRGDMDVDPVAGPIVFEEGKNILSAQFQRQYPTANRVLIEGGDSGAGYQIHFEAASSNPFMEPTSYHYDPNPPSSDWIQFDTVEFATLYGFGMDAETVAQARLLEVNRETVAGQLTTAEDWLIGPAQTHLVQGPAGQADRLGTGEKVFVQGNTMDLSLTAQGAPIWSQTPSYLGGGLPDADLVAPPA